MTSRSQPIIASGLWGTSIKIDPTCFVSYLHMAMISEFLQGPLEQRDLITHITIPSTHLDDIYSLTIKYLSKIEDLNLKDITLHKHMISIDLPNDLHITLVYKRNVGKLFDADKRIIKAYNSALDKLAIN